MSLMSNQPTYEMILKTISIVFLFLQLFSTLVLGQSLWLDDFENTSGTSWHFENSWSIQAGSAANSGQYNIQHKGNTPSSTKSPLINLSQASDISVAFYARRSSTYPQENLSLMASIDGGNSFQVMILENALPINSGSSYTLVESPIIPALSNQAEVIFRFEGSGGSSTASIIRIDDFAINGLGTIPTNSASVSSPEMVSIGSTFELQIDLDLADAPAGVNGLEFNLTFCDALSEFESIQGNADIATKNWSMDFQVDSNKVHVVLMGRDGTSLQEGSYLGLLNFRFTANDIGVCVLHLERALASEAVSDAGDLSISILNGRSETEFRESAASFEISVDSLHYGTLRHELVESSSFWISNKSGTRNLFLRLASDRPEVTVSPSEAELAPGDSNLFTSTFDARTGVEGPLNGLILIGHNAPESDYRLPVSGHILPWRGDVNSDQEVDLRDLVQSINIILGRYDASEMELWTADNFPFSLEDGFVDIRDLGVLAFALLNESWPDNSTLPQTVKYLHHANPILQGHDQIIKPKWTKVGGIVKVSFSESDKVQAVYFESNANLISDGTFHSQQTESETTSKTIAYKLADSFSSRDSLQFQSSNESVVLFSAYAVNQSGQLLSIDLSDLEDSPQASYNISLYPNPLSSSVRTLQIDLNNRTQAEIQIYNVLGQSVGHLKTDELGRASWNSEGHSPGLYFVQSKSDNLEFSKAFVLLE